MVQALQPQPQARAAGKSHRIRVAPAAEAAVVVILVVAGEAIFFPNLFLLRRRQFSGKRQPALRHVRHQRPPTPRSPERSRNLLTEPCGTLTKPTRQSRELALHPPHSLFSPPFTLHTRCSHILAAQLFQLRRLWPHVTRVRASCPPAPLQYMRLYRPQVTPGSARCRCRASSHPPHVAASIPAPTRPVSAAVYPAIARKIARAGGGQRTCAGDACAPTGTRVFPNTFAAHPPHPTSHPHPPHVTSHPPATRHGNAAALKSCPSRPCRIQPAARTAENQVPRWRFSMK